MLSYFALAHGKSVLIWLVYGVNVTPYVSALPPTLLMSRQEWALFHWSIPSSAQVMLILLGDLCMSNAALPPTVGAAGTLALGSGLFLAGLQPTGGFFLTGAAWMISALCQLLLADAPAPKSTRHNPGLSVVVAARGMGRPSSAALQLRVFGWCKPVYLPLDTVAVVVLVAITLFAKPAWTWAAIKLVHTLLGKLIYPPLDKLRTRAFLMVFGSAI